MKHIEIILKILGICIAFFVVRMLWAMMDIANVPFLIYRIFLQPKTERAAYFEKWSNNALFSTDQNSNAVHSPIWNTIMLKRWSEEFYGNPDETLSHVEGKAWYADRLGKFGQLFGHVHNWIYATFLGEQNHIQNAANRPQ
ncbi:hypothetical protein LAG90_15600 [Marinilongibacter aquaticus]|uniref:hypothetical protein n=1 Tax=Marinilongibacter aquaticus TaxID=2975157 RepID=UPI0021BD7FA7|nr:hypothetical protein [Marinilongibacter aquaticus]UBM58228.1 hypothetical protein LAG90_15600 [Marinilongibacter aquaticus]